MGVWKQRVNHHQEKRMSEQQSMCEKGVVMETERFLMGAVWREFNPCLSSLEAIVALSQAYQLSHQPD